MRPNSSNLTRSALLAAAALLSTCPAIHAAIVTWDGGGATDNFSDAANWSPDTTLVASTGNTYTFTGSTRLAPNQDLSQLTADQVFNFDASAGAFVIGGNATRVGGITNSSSNLQTFNLSLRYPGTRNIDTGASGIRLNTAPLSTGTSGRTVTKSGSGDLTFNFTQANNTLMSYTVNAGRIVQTNASGTYNHNATITLTSGTSLVLAQAGTANFGGTLTGAGSVRKTAAGANTLSGTVTYTGDTTVETGTLTYGAAYTPSATSTTTLNLKGAATPVAGTDFGQIVTNNAAYTFGGLLSLNFIDAAVVGSTYNLFDTSGTGSLAGSFTGVSLAGNYTGSLTNNSGTWTGLISGLSFSFSQATGDLTVAVPEPATCAALAGALALGFAAWRRRKA